MRNFLLILMCCFIVSNKSFAQDDILSLEEAITVGMENNFNIKIAENNNEIAENNNSIGNAGFLPAVSLRASRSFSNQNVNQEFFNGNVNSRTGAKSNTFNTGVDINWTIFDGMRMFRTYEKLSELKGIGNIDEWITVENTIQDIIINYYLIIVEKNSVAALDTSLQLSEERLAISKSQYEVGKASKMEYLSAQVDYNADYSALIKQKEFLNKSKNDLNNLMGREISTFFEVPLSIPLDSTLNLEELLSDALTANKNLIRFRREVNVASLQAEEIESEKMPSLDLNFSYSYNTLNSQAGFLLFNQVYGFNYGLSANWMLFNGNNINRRYQNARINLETSRERVKQARLALERDIENVYLEYSNNLTLVKLERENLGVAMENASIALDRYRLGKSNFLELREAQVNSVRAYERLLTAIYNAKLAEIELLRLSGRLDMQ